MEQDKARVLWRTFVPLRTHLQLLSNLALSGASRFKIKILSETVHLSDVSVRERRSEGPRL